MILRVDDCDELSVGVETVLDYVKFKESIREQVLKNSRDK